MCMICDSWNQNSLTLNQAVSNTFESKEAIGVDHTKEVVTLCDFDLSFSEGKTGAMMQEIATFIAPPEEPEIDRSLL